MWGTVRGGRDAAVYSFAHPLDFSLAMVAAGQIVAP